MTISTERLRERISHLQERLKGMRQHKYPDDCANAAAFLESLKAEKQQDIDLLTELLAVREAQSKPAPIAFSENADADMCRKWAWEQVKKDVTTDSWTIGDSSNFYGFYCCGWDMRRQYNEQRPPAVPADVIGTLKLALDAMEFMGNTLNELDAATPDGIVRVTPAFSAVREMLAAAPTKAVNDENNI